MAEGGRIEGYLLTKEQRSNVTKALSALSDRKRFEEKYSADKDMGTLVFAVGDGNHSLATARASYEKIKASLPLNAALSHPARYALAEIENLHSPALEFEAIHRLVFDCDADKLMERAREEMMLTEEKPEGPCQSFIAVTKDGEKEYYIRKPSSRLSVGTLQKFLDEYLPEVKGASIDYIHGSDTTRELVGSKEGRIGFILPAMEKNELFDTVIHDGALPRKTFSMGSADEKRFYLEARKIR